MSYTLVPTVQPERFEDAFVPAYLATAIAGRSIGVRILEDAEARSWTDGSDIHTGGSSDRETQIAVQAALLGAGSLDRAIVLRLVGRPALARRYLSVEAPRALLACADRLPRRVLADPRLSEKVPQSSSARHSLEIAQSHRPLPEPSTLLGEIRAVAVVRKGEPSPRSDGLTSDERTLRARTDPALNDEEATDESKVLALFSSLASGGGPLARLFKSLVGMGTQPGGDQTMVGGAGEDLSEGAARRHASPGLILSRTSRTASISTQLGEPLIGRRYPEWDERMGRYREKHVHVTEFEPWDAENSVDKTRLDLHPDRPLQRSLARLGLGFDAHRRQKAGDEIVTDDLVRLVSDIRAGRAGDTAIYRALLRTKRDLGVLILIDSSSSSRDIGPDGRSIQEQQLSLGWQLATALERAGDRVAVYGFNSWGRERVHVMRVKAFDQRTEGAALGRLALLGPTGFSRIGAAVRHAGQTIERLSGMPFRLVVLITDGLSYDDGYEANYGEADTRRSIQELRDRQTACLCLSVAGDADNAKLRRVFGEAAFLKAEHFEHLSPRIAKMFADAIAAVAKR